MCMCFKKTLKQIWQCVSLIGVSMHVYVFQETLKQIWQCLSLNGVSTEIIVFLCSYHYT